MESLKYTIIKTTTIGQILYIHKEKQAYKRHRITKEGQFFKCTFIGCNCMIIRIDHNCYRRNPKTEHNHSENSEQKMKKKMKKVLAIRIMQRMFANEGKIIQQEAFNEINKKIGGVGKRTVKCIRDSLYSVDKTICTGTFLTVEPVQIIPLDKIQKISKDT